MRGETSIAELCRREGIAESMYYSWSKEFLDAGKRRLAGATARAATTDERVALSDKDGLPPTAAKGAVFSIDRQATSRGAYSARGIAW